jgi:transposase-like protein
MAMRVRALSPVCECCDGTVEVAQAWLCPVCREQLSLLPGGRDHRLLLLDGIARAKAAGKYKGRKPSIDAANVRRLRAELGAAAIAKKLGIARSSVYRLLDGRPR